MTTDMDYTEAWTRRDADLIRAVASLARRTPEHMRAAHMAPRLDAENGEEGYGE